MAFRHRIGLIFALAASGAVVGSAAAQTVCRDATECTRLCDAGDSEGCYRAAQEVFKAGKNSSIEERRQATKPFYEKACEQGHAKSCTALAGIVRFGTNADKPRAKSLYERACTAGDSSACSSLASVAEFGGLELDRRQFASRLDIAFSYLEKSCQLGSAYSCIEVARRTIQGKGVTASVAQGMKIFRARCEEKKSPVICSAWADHLVTGVSGAAKDQKKAHALYRDACENQSFMKACVGAAQLERTGAKGVKKDTAQAKTRLERACSRNYMTACGELGRMHETGEGGEASSARALELYEKACPPGKNTLGDACYYAALLYENGAPGVARQPDKVADTYARACTYGVIDPSISERACRKAAPLLRAEGKQREAHRMYSTLCQRHRDQFACGEKTKLSVLPSPKPPATAPARP
jgi:TPR repeat protein